MLRRVTGRVKKNDIGSEGEVGIDGTKEGGDVAIIETVKDKDNIK